MKYVPTIYSTIFIIKKYSLIYHLPQIAEIEIDENAKMNEMLFSISFQWITESQM